MSDQPLDPDILAFQRALSTFDSSTDEDADDDSLDEPEEAQNSPALVQPQLAAGGQPEGTTRKRGGQPGNLNALKHGLYLENNHLFNTNIVERAQLCDFKSLIEHLKDYTERLYTMGMQSKDLEDVNMTLRSLSLACMALTRLLNTHNENSSTHLTYDYYEEDHRKVTRYSFIKGLMKNIDSFIDLSDIKQQIAEYERDERQSPR